MALANGPAIRVLLVLAFEIACGRTGHGILARCAAEDQLGRRKAIPWGIPWETKSLPGSTGIDPRPLSTCSSILPQPHGRMVASPAPPFLPLLPEGPVRVAPRYKIRSRPAASGPAVSAGTSLYSSRDTPRSLAEAVLSTPPRGLDWQRMILQAFSPVFEDVDWQDSVWICAARISGVRGPWMSRIE